MNPVMYIFVNKDLNMGKGKIAAQVGHVVQLITEEIIRQGYENKPTPKSYFDYMQWKEHFAKKIVLKTSEDKLKELIKMKDARYIIDCGFTQVAPNSLTVVGFYPSNEFINDFKDYKLL